jgi:hypothetical protein
MSNLRVFKIVNRNGEHNFTVGNHVEYKSFLYEKYKLFGYKKRRLNVNLPYYEDKLDSCTEVYLHLGRYVVSYVFNFHKVNSRKAAEKYAETHDIEVVDELVNQELINAINF